MMTPYPAPIAAMHVNPAPHPPAVSAPAVDSTAHGASPAEADVTAGPSSTAATAAATAGPQNETSQKPFTWKTNPALLARQETAARQVPSRQSSSRRHISDVRHTGAIRGTYNATAYPCDTCRYHFDIRLDRREAFVNWFRDGDNTDNHVFFVLSLLFAISLSMSLTFAWLEATHRMANMSLLLTVPLGIAFAVHSFLWASLALYCLWLYPRAFWRWKNQTLPLVAQHFLRMTTTPDPAADQVP
ncbi:uncharacterized protein LOC119404110 [Rhipicephalus sanguineus]|uniref:uncharacterized protein LOC119404110 n=1 Tax=Rhipicephalus sanguineus TaxID=34632 RepID=UPI0020C3FAE8|nr:uncharacterized protein LOC119404110 [Rhipicephalus sanguineus]